MVHVRPYRLDGVEPDAMNQTEVAWCERRRMRSKEVGIGAAAAVMNHEPDIKAFRLLRPLPGVA